MIRFRPKGKAALAAILSVQIVVLGQMATQADAAMLSTDTAIDRYAAHQDRAWLLSELGRAEIQEKMEELGVDPAEAERRLQAMSDEEVAAAVQRIENDPAGADGVGSIVGALVTIFIILLITDLLCLTRFFPFTRCAR